MSDITGGPTMLNLNPKPPLPLFNVVRLQYQSNPIWFCVLLIFPAQLNTALNRGNGGFSHNSADNYENIFSNLMSHVSMSLIVDLPFFGNSYFYIQIISHVKCRLAYMVCHIITLIYSRLNGHQALV